MSLIEWIYNAAPYLGALAALISLTAAALGLRDAARRKNKP